jgi:hypothetical protein
LPPLSPDIRGRIMTTSLFNPKNASRAAACLALMAGLAGFAACSDISNIGVIYNSQRYLSGTALYVTHAAGSRMPAVIRGNPFALPKADVDQIVRDHMKGSNFGREITFVPGPDKPPFPDSRLVLIFNGAVAGQLQLCQNDISSGGGPAQDGRIEVMAAFCSGSRPVTALAGGISGVTDPNDPKFRAFLRQIGTTLFNPNNPEDNPGRDVGPPVP